MTVIESMIDERYERVLELLDGVAYIFGEPFDIDNEKHRLVVAHELGIQIERTRVNDGLEALRSELR